MGIKKDFGNINMELLDVLDENGNLTGEKMERGKVHELGIWHRCVHIWIINSKGELLLQKCAKKPQKNLGGLWDVSAAGHVEAGETVEEAALKELREELGLEIPFEEFILLKELKISVSMGDRGFKNHFDVVFLIKKDLDTTKLNLQEEEVEKVEFVHWRKVRERFLNNDPTLAIRNQEFEILFEYLENNSL